MADNGNAGHENESTLRAEQPGRPLPDPTKLSASGLTDGQKRRIFFVVIGIVGVIVLANIVGSHSSLPAKQPTTTQRMQQQNPTREQIQAWEDSVQQSQKQLEEEMKQRGQAPDGQRNPGLTAADLQRQDACNRLRMHAGNTKQASARPIPKKHNAGSAGRSARSRHISRCSPTTWSGNKTHSRSRFPIHRSLRRPMGTGKGRAWRRCPARSSSAGQERCSR